METKKVDCIKIFDTTLRDGEQSPGISFNPDQKVEIAKQLADIGVDIIEAGFPINRMDFEAVKSVASEVGKSALSPVICGLARAEKGDIDICWDAISGATRPRIHTFISTSQVHMDEMLHKTPKEVIDITARSVAYAKNFTDDVEFSPMDATRSDFDFMVQVVQAAIEAGATTINIPDTVGYSMPWDFEGLIKRVVERAERINPRIVISAHCHDDLGMATANSVAAIRGGARQIECTINGIGERAGNAASEEVVAAIKVGGDLGVSSKIATKGLLAISKTVADFSKYPVAYNKAVVGRNAFVHESGIHQSGVLNDPNTYEVLDSKEFGTKTTIVAGKHSGKHGRQVVDESGVISQDFGGLAVSV